MTTQLDQYLAALMITFLGGFAIGRMLYHYRQPDPEEEAAAGPPTDPPMPDQVVPDPHLDARLMLELTLWDIGAAKTLIGTMILYEPGRATYWLIVESCTEILYAGKQERSL